MTLLGTMPVGLTLPMLQQLPMSLPCLSGESSGFGVLGNPQRETVYKSL